MLRKFILGKSNCMMVRTICWRKERIHYKDGNNAALLIAWIAYNIKTKCYTKNGGDRREN